MSLFSERGVRLPHNELMDKRAFGHQIEAPHWKYRFNAPQFFGKIHFEKALKQFQQYLPVGSELPDLAAFHARFMAIIDMIDGREDVRNILNGPCLPLAFAAGSIRTDLGVHIESNVLSGIKAAYKNQYEKSPFKITEGTLTNQVGYVPESNFKLLLEAMYAGPVVAAYFPNALCSWSILMARQQMATLPSDIRFVLPDVIIHGHAYIGYPDVMACCRTGDHKVPDLYCAANTWRKNSTLSFMIGDHGFLSLSCGGINLSAALSWFSGGLLVLD